MDNQKQDSVAFECNISVCEVEMPAHYPGGIAAWQKYLSDSTFYPEIAYNHRTGGVARIQFTISEYGWITNVFPLNELEDGLMEEAVRVIKNSPRWQPALQNGKAVSYRFVQQIIFEWHQQEDEKVDSSCQHDKSTIPIS